MLLRAFTATPPAAAALPPPSIPPIHPANPLKLNSLKNKHKPLTSSPISLRKTQTASCTTASTSTAQTSEYDYEFEFDDYDEDDDGSCPWEGAIMYKRNAAVSYVEYCTTLERLGLGKVSSEVSKSKAKAMGLRVLKTVKDYPNGTPVLVSAEVVRKKDRLRLNGIVRTVIGLPCNRCGKPASQSVYSEFSLLLCEEPIEEPETIIDLGTIFGEDMGGGDEDDEDYLIDFDDRLYFPAHEKVVDISKNIRDLIHIEITLTAVCDANCRGSCLMCGANLNNSKCTCKASDVEEKGLGPLANLRQQMQKT